MNKSDLVHAIVAETGVTARSAEAVVNAFIDTVMGAVARGEKVSLVGFGSFATITRKAREGRNPSTGAPIKIPAKTVPKFTPGKSFLDKV